MGNLELIGYTILCSTLLGSNIHFYNNKLLIMISYL